MIRGLRLSVATAACAVVALSLAAVSDDANAAAGTAALRSAPSVTTEANVVQVSERRRKPQVRGFVRRGGYYSYHPEDSINTYGDSRTRYGSANFFRNPTLDQQTRFGPFDHGFFYDSGITTPYGGNSPYNH